MQNKAAWGIRQGIARLAAVAAAGAAALWLGLAPAAAQGPFATRITVNDRVITNWEVDQRALFLELFGTPGDLVAEAEERLIDERLQKAVADRMGIRLTDEQIMAGMAEFAGRVDLTVEEFLEIVGTVGIDPLSYRDFIEAGMLWREVARTRFAPRILVTDADVDRAKADWSQRSAVRVQLAEIVLPTVGLQAIESRRLARRLQEIRTVPAFTAAVREHSIADSAARDGLLDWIPLIHVPPEFAGLLLSLSPGQVTPPIPVEGGLAVYQLRRVEELSTIPPAAVAVQYALITLQGSGARADLDRALARVDVCDDFYRAFAGGDPARLQIERRRITELPAGIATELARLNPGAGSTALSTGDTLVYLHLCERALSTDGPFGREGMRERIFNDRIQQMAATFLSEMRADAHIRRR